MTWWVWVLIWVVMLAATAWIFFVLGRSLWRKTSALFVELGTAADRLSAVSDGLQQLADQTHEPAVFRSASELRQERILAGRRPDGGRSPLT